MKVSPMNSIKNFFDLLAKIIIVFTSVLMVLLTAVIFFNIVVRYFFSIPIAFTYEMAELLFPWIVFLAIINVTLDNENIDIQFFVRLFPKPFQVVSAYFTKLVMLFFSIYITLSSFKLATTVKNHTMPILGLSKSWLYWSVTFSFAGVTLVIIYQVVLMIIGKDESEEGGEIR